jgi:O-antigen ligase
MTRINSLLFLLVPVTLVLMTLLYGGVHSPILALFYLSMLAVVVLWSIESWRTGELALSRSRLQLPLLGLALYGIVQTVPWGSVNDASGVSDIPRTISVDIFATKMAVLQIAALAVFFAAALVSINSSLRVRRVATFITIFGFAYAFFAVLQSVLSPESIYGIYKPLAARPFGSFVNRNDFAAMMVMLASIPLGLLFSGAVARERRLLYVVAVALMGASILLSQSRGGLVAFVGEIILLVIFTSRAHGRKKLALKAALSALFLLAALGGAIFVGGDTGLNRFQGNDVISEAPTETTSRFHIWSVTLKVIGDRLPFGAGLGSFPAVYPAFDTSGGSKRVEQAHNDYLQLISDAGVPGGLLGVLFLVFWIRQSRSGLAKREPFAHGIAAGAVAGTAAVLLHSAFDFVLHITSIALMFLLLLAMLVASEREPDPDVPIYRRERRPPSVRSIQRSS